MDKNLLSSILNEAENTPSKSKNNNYNSSSSDKSFGREIDDFEIKYEINDNDDQLVAAMKELINNSHIKKSELYSFVGRTDGYNLYYSLLQGRISWKRVETWCNILGVSPIIKFVKNN